jgi:hypothetical protein
MGTIVLAPKSRFDAVRMAALRKAKVVSRPAGAAKGAKGRSRG